MAFDASAPWRESDRKADEATKVGWLIGALEAIRDNDPSPQAVATARATLERYRAAVGPLSGWKRPMFDRLDTPILAEMELLVTSTHPLDRAIGELWRGRSIVSSVTAARLTREQADAILVALGEMPAEPANSQASADE